MSSRSGPCKSAQKYIDESADPWRIPEELSMVANRALCAKNSSSEGIPYSR